MRFPFVGDGALPTQNCLSNAGCQLLPYLLSATSQLATDVHNEFLIHSFNLNIGLMVMLVSQFRKFKRGEG